MDGIIVKTAPLDNLMMFKDNGNGTVDATKVMVKMLEEKINKKIEIIETKGKGQGKEGEGIDNLEFEQKMEEYKFIHLDQEHEQEINLKNEEFENVINKLEKERLLNQGEISSLTNDINFFFSNVPTNLSKSSEQ